jgi:hypothetical protein
MEMLAKRFIKKVKKKNIKKLKCSPNPLKITNC